MPAATPRCPACGANLPRQLIRMNFRCPRCRSALKIRGYLAFILVVIAIGGIPALIFSNLAGVIGGTLLTAVAAVLYYHRVLMVKHIAED